MELKSVKVNDLPLSSNVSYSNDIQTYITNMLSGVSYNIPNDFMSTPIIQILSSMMTTLSSIVVVFGGKT